MDIDHISSDHMSNAFPDVITGDVCVVVRTRFLLKRVSTSQNPFQLLHHLKRVWLVKTRFQLRLYIMGI